MDFQQKMKRIQALILVENIAEIYSQDFNPCFEDTDWSRLNTSKKY